MKNINILKGVAVIGLLLVISISAQENRDNPSELKGLQKDFYNLERELEKNEVVDKEAFKKRTILIALQRALFRKYRLTKVDEITEAQLTIEQPIEDHFIYYVKYNKFLARFKYLNDPAKYRAIPSETKVIIPKKDKLSLEREKDILAFDEKK